MSELVKTFICKIKITLTDLQSIIGCLNHCCYVIHSGRAFLRRLIDLTIGITSPHHHIRLNKGERADLKMWHEFWKKINGSAFFLHEEWVNVIPLHRFGAEHWLRVSIWIKLVCGQMARTLENIQYNIY